MNSKQRLDMCACIAALDERVAELDEELPTGEKGKVSNLAVIRNGVALQSYLLKCLYTDVTGENPWQ
jgi:hypothetical protein